MILEIGMQRRWLPPTPQAGLTIKRAKEKRARAVERDRDNGAGGGMESKLLHFKFKYTS